LLFALGDYCAIPQLSKVAEDPWICVITYMSSKVQFLIYIITKHIYEMQLLQSFYIEYCVVGYENFAKVHGKVLNIPKSVWISNSYQKLDTCMLAKN